MRTLTWDIAALAAVLTTMLGFEAGLIAAGNAFFVVVSVLAVYTGHQLIQRQHMALGEAVKSMLTRPESHGRRLNFAAYVTTAALGTIVLAQTLTYL